MAAFNYTTGIELAPTAKQLGRMAFYQTNMALSAILSVAYPTGCTLAEATEWAESLTDEQIAECLAIG